MHINELQSRRAALFDKMEDESFALLFAGKPKSLSADQDYPSNPTATSSTSPG